MTVRLPPGIAPLALDTLLIRDAPANSEPYGRFNNNWIRVAEEAPYDGKQYARKDTGWVEVTSSGIYVQDDPPTQPVPPNSLWWDSNAGKLYLWYDDGTSVQWVEVSGGAGGEVPDFGIGLSVDRTQTPPIVNLTPAGWAAQFLGGVYTNGGRTAIEGLDLSAAGTGLLSVPLATDLLAGSIVEPLPDALLYGRTRSLVGVSTWKEIPATKIAGHGKTDLGVVFVPARSLGQGLDLRSDGGLWAPLATHAHAGSIVEPPVADKQHARIRDPITGINRWEEIAAVKPAGHTKPEIGVVYTPARTPQQGLTLDPDGCLRLFRATNQHLGGILEPDVTNKQHARLRDSATGVGRWEEIPASRPAGHTKPEIGVVYVPARGPGQGLNVAPDGFLTAPLATPDHAGTITEPRVTGKQHARIRNLVTGISTWEEIPTVKPAGHTKPEIGVVYTPARTPQQGLTLDPDGCLRLFRATNQHLGGILEPDATAKQFARVRDQTTGVGKWEEIQAAKIAGHVPADVGVVYVPGRTVLQGLELAADGKLSAPLASSSIAGTIVEPQKGVGQLWARTTDAGGLSTWKNVYNIGTLTYRGAWQPTPNTPNIGALPGKLNGDFWIVDCVDPNVAETPPLGSTPGLDGVQLKEGDWAVWSEGAQLFNHVQRQAVEAGIGLTQNGSAFDLNTANTDGEIGGVKIVGRGPTQGLEYDIVTGTLWAPLATHNAAGSIVEPQPDGKQYARSRDVTGYSTWQPVKAVNPAGETLAEIGVVYVPPKNGLLVEKDGLLRATIATYDEYGVIKEPPPLPADKTYVRKFGQWIESVAGGATVIVADTPPANPVKDSLWWESDSGNLYIYYQDVNSAQWVHINGDTQYDFGIGLDQKNGVVDLKPANFNGEIGGVSIVGRSPLNGLEYDIATGTLWAPPGTDKLAGTIVDAPLDGKPYARTNDAVNGARWAETSNGAVIIGDDPPAIPPTPGALWFDSNAGTLAVYYQDADSSQWVQVNGSQSSGDYLPLTGGTVTGPIVLPTADPTLDTHATHKKYVDTAVATNSLYQSTWQVALNIPDLTVATANPLHGYSWTAVTVNAAIPETAPAGLPGIGGTSIASGDTIKYNATLLLYEHIKTASSAGGIGDAPSDGEEYVRKDATWVIGSGVLKTGDTMTGTLVSPEIQIKAAAQAASGLRLFPAASPNGARIDFQTADGSARKGYIGYGNDTTLMLHAETGKQWRVTGGLQVTGGNVLIPDTTAGRGFFIGDPWHGMYFNGSNTLVFTEYHNRFEWRAQTSGTQPGGTVGMSLYGNNLSVAGTVTAGGMLNINGGAILSETLGMQIGQTQDRMIGGGNGNGGIVYRSSDRHKMFVGPSLFMEIDSGGVEMWGTVTDSRSLAEDLPGSQSADGGFNVIATLKLMAAKIKAMEAEITALKGAR